MPVKIDMTGREFNTVAQLIKDYDILYEALERISGLVFSGLPIRAEDIAELALDRVTIKP